MNTADVTIARKIARIIRQSSGGLPYVRALGLLVKGKAQVSMNLTNYRISPLPLVLEAIRREARRHGAAIESGEIIGFMPEDALSQSEALEYKVQNYSAERLLERRLAALL